MTDYRVLLDEELLDLLSSKSDHAAYAELYHRYFHKLCCFVKRACPEEDVPADIAQDILLYLWEQRKEIHIHSKLVYFLYRAAFNQVLKRQRREKVINAFETYFKSHYDEAYESTDNAIALKEINETVDRALEYMSPKMKLVFTSSRFNHMQNAEISEQFGIPRNTVKDQVKGALRILRKMGLKLNAIFF
ncbi:sigma-70 family RNA polymerase sigma factor [Chitinophaga horti]|uniref:Sigma-70 family RNA polymerase sigma factor n=1 Tax=Chitinophaga horti TaxID=2920382 RepID=A0ABY6J0B7_9BACT|nr:sigma-70 family RNA polymerase sigma factor [Chitinophaga horti]UYQ91769.1 sigma-70 family RNA polymerase sigma factor [Chitinophaga horti]